jgi:phytoene synthase
MTVQESYVFCERLARKQARNFYLTFQLLSKPQRRAMCAIYAFMRSCDDLSDGEGVADRSGAIAQWREQLSQALNGNAPDHPIWPAFTDAVASYRIPHRYFDEMIAGVSSDLEPRRIETFDELYRYCYQVASVVGLTIVHVFGFDSPDALPLAEKCGVAFQLTNILRDVKEDAEKGRIYLPAEDLRRFQVGMKDLLAKTPSAALRKLLEFETQRARAYYRESAPLVALIHPGSRASIRALIGIYSRLLEKIAGSGYDVLARRIRVPGWQKLWIVARSL